MILLTPLVTALVAGCAVPFGPPTAQADAQREASCRERVEALYLKQNRAELFTSDTAADRYSPYSGRADTALTTDGLSGRFARQQQYNDCLHESGPAAPVQ
jgi:hypothetical protein